MTNKNNIFLALCYHYIRQQPDAGFNTILGCSVETFKEHIKLIKRNFQVIALKEAEGVLFEKRPLKKIGLLFTFDDALSDHYLAAQILAEHKIKGVFFIPTCTIADNLPANPTILHYCLAVYKIKRFLGVYKEALDEYGLNKAGCDIDYENGVDDPWKTIESLKLIFRFRLKFEQARSILLFIYKKLLLADYPDILSTMHLNRENISDIVKMGHRLGAHGHTHSSVSDPALTLENLKNEVTEPKKILEKNFSLNIDAFSYPFGEKEDYLLSKKLIEKEKPYKCAFTIKKIKNTNKTSPFALGRYMPNKADTPAMLMHTLIKIVETGG